MPADNNLSSDGFSLGRALGLPPYTFRRLLLLLSCILAVFQYGMILTNGGRESDFDAYFGLRQSQGDALYSVMNFGACGLGFIPGLCYDKLGFVLSTVIGTLMFDVGVAVPLLLGKKTPLLGQDFGNICFGCASSFFNTLGQFAPLVAFPTKHVGKVSTVIQVSLSLSITLQSQAYFALRSASGNNVEKRVHFFQIYAIGITTLTGIFMCVIGLVCRSILKPNEEETGSTEAPQATRSLWATLLTYEFAYFVILFFIPIGFSFSFLNVETRIASEVDLTANDLATPFGILNALGRVCVNAPLDYTRHHPLGGVFTYLLLSLATFTVGMVFLVLPSPGRTYVQIANVFVGLGYGGILGIIPPALRLYMGIDYLGFIFGILYIGVAISEPLWGLLFFKPHSCSGVGCYRLYNLSCIGGLALTLDLTVAMLFLHVRASRQSRVREVLLNDVQTDELGAQPNNSR